MNKIYLWGIIVTAAMLGFTYISVIGSKGGLNGDIVNMLAIAGAAALVVITVFVIVKYVRQMQTDEASGELADEVWDEDIREYYNPIPTGWAIIYLMTMAWGMWYFTIGYPVNGYSQIGEYNEDVQAHDKKFQEEYASITGDRLVEMGESVFLAECKVCHGIGADGIDGKAADLNVWGSARAIEDTIAKGSKGLNYPMGDMPAGMAAGQDAKDIAAFVMNGLSGTTGAEAYTNACSSCHGGDGKGMDGMSPDLSTYGTASFTVDVLNRGKKGSMGIMPIFDRLNQKQKEAVGAYITSLSKGE